MKFELNFEFIELWNSMKSYTSLGTKAVLVYSVRTFSASCHNAVKCNLLERFGLARFVPDPGSCMQLEHLLSVLVHVLYLSTCFSVHMCQMTGASSPQQSASH
jgi:hypothetical protein